MKEVIQEILDEEKQARDRIEEARGQARQATEAAQVAAQQSIENARAAALQEAEQILAKAREETAREQTELISAALKKRDEAIIVNQANITNAVNLLVQKITNMEDPER